MRIVLLRHGEPAVSRHRWLKAKDMHQWIASYNAAGLIPDQKTSSAAVEIATQCSTVVCSDLPRSLESAHVLGIQDITVIESTFREMGLPYGNWPLFSFPPELWAVVFRISWFLGYSSNCETFREGKQRAMVGAAKLTNLANQTGSVLLVGHRLYNQFVAQSLVSQGWQGPTNPSKHYWEFGIYEYAKNV